MASTLFTNWGTVWAGYASSETYLNEIVITDLTTPSSGQGTHSGATPGTRVGSFLPAGCATLLNFAIARRYRGGKPRLYLPYGTASDLTTSSAWSTGYQAGITASWTTWQSDTLAAAPSGTTITSQVNVSYYEGFTNEAYGTPTKYRRVPTLRVGGPLIDSITGYSTNGRPASQRRRNLHSV